MSDFNRVGRITENKVFFKSAFRSTYTISINLTCIYCQKNIDRLWKTFSEFSYFVIYLKTTGNQETFCCIACGCRAWSSLSLTQNYIYLGTLRDSINNTKLHNFKFQLAIIRQSNIIHCTKNEVFHEGYFSKCDQIRRKLLLKNLMKKSLMENFIFRAAIVN